MDWLECSPIDPLVRWLKVTMILSSCSLMRPKSIKEEIKRLHHCSHSIIHQLTHLITLFHSLLEKTITETLDAMPHGSTQKRFRSSIIPMSPSTKWLPPFAGHGKTLSISTALMACSSNPRSLTTSLLVLSCRTCRATATSATVMTILHTHITLQKSMP